MRICVCCAIVLLAGTMRADDKKETMPAVEAAAKEDVPEFATDRPDFTESAEVVGRGYVQLESGFTLDVSRLDRERARSTTGPLPLVRVGLSKRVELRLAGDGYTWQRIRSTEEAARAEGRSDFSLGGKVKLADQTRYMPDVAVIGAVSVPKGNPEFTSGGYDPELKLCLAKDAPAGFVLSSNFNFASVSDGDGRMLGRSVSLSAGHDLALGFAGYWEAYHINLDRGLGNTTIFNSGVTHMIGKNVQLDVEAGRSVSGVQVGWFLGVGFTIRQPLGFARR